MTPNYQNEARERAAAVQFSSLEWWVTGGWSVPDYVASTEVLDLSTGPFFSLDVELPENMWSHNLVAINDSHVVALGGGVPNDQVYLYDRFGVENCTINYEFLVIAKDYCNPGLCCLHCQSRES